MPKVTLLLVCVLPLSLGACATAVATAGAVTSVAVSTVGAVGSVAVSAAGAAVGAVGSTIRGK